MEKICWDCTFETQAESVHPNSRAPVILHSEDSSKIKSLLLTTPHGHVSLSNISHVPPRKSHLVPIFNMGPFGDSLLQAYYVWHRKGMPKVQEEISERVCSLSLTLDLESTTLLNWISICHFLPQLINRLASFQSYQQMTAKIVVTKERESTSWKAPGLVKAKHCELGILFISLHSNT